MEQRFLYQVAQKYFEHHEWHLNSVTFVVPNKRSAFFLREHVGELMKKDPSLGNPVVMTMTELMEKTAGQKKSVIIATAGDALFRIPECVAEKTGKIQAAAGRI